MFREGLLEQEVIFEQFDNVPPEPPLTQVVSDPGGAITGLSSNTLVVGGKIGTVQNVEAPQPIGTGSSPTFANVTSPGLVDAGDLRVGGAETIKLIDFGSVAADPGSIAAQTRGSVDVTITGVAVGDFVMMNPPDGLNTGLVYAGCRVTAANTVRIYLGNLTGAAIDDGSLNWNYVWMDIT